MFIDASMYLYVVRRSFFSRGQNDEQCMDKVRLLSDDVYIAGLFLRVSDGIIEIAEGSDLSAIVQKVCEFPARR